jgi:hypothetical protein
MRNNINLVSKATKKLFLKLSIFSVFLVIFVGVIAFARGYRFSPTQGKITSTGILSVNSYPKQASIYVNDQLSGATDSNITLPYGTYSVEVKKEGYSSWQKTVSLKGEIVMSLNAKLFLKNPALTPLTSIGVTKAVSVGNTDRLIAVSKSGDLENDGIYLFEPSSQPVAIFPSLKMIMSAAILPVQFDLNSAEFIFDPTYRQAIVTFSQNTEKIDKNESEKLETVSYLLKLDTQNLKLYNLSSTKDSIIEKWNLDRQKEVIKIIETLPKKLQSVARDSMLIVSVSPDDKKLLYIATSNNTLPLVITPPLIGANQEPESRDIATGKLFVYDKREDKNYEITAIKMPELPKKKVLNDSDLNSNVEINEVYSFLSKVRKTVTWFPTSDYLAVNEGEKISAISYDNAHKEVLYAGPYDTEYFNISGEGEILTLINLNPQSNSQGDLYSISLW